MIPAPPPSPPTVSDAATETLPTTFWSGVWPRCVSLIVWKLSMTLEFFSPLSTVPDCRWIHQPLFSLQGHLWCHCKHKLCPEMKDQPGFVPFRGQSNSKCGQAAARIIGLGGHYGGSERTSSRQKKIGGNPSWTSLKAPSIFPSDSALRRGKKPRISSIKLNLHFTVTIFYF